ncbi:TPA: type I methionyl aminopeptidase [Candidatus Galligastranaerophilus gallistercoris]|nr:type I methionyl aminopeptidase [Candidatus Galligastranaerophilus gallistercoris]
MVAKKSREEIKLMKMAGSIVAKVHQAMKESIREGISTLELDKIAYDVIKENKATPTFLGYRGFPGSICASINEEVVHGIPSKDRILKNGDIISIDVGATYHGLVGDSAWTYTVGEVDPKVKKLLETTERALFAGISKMIEGNVLDDVSGAVEDVAKEGGYGIVRQYGGHGVGYNMHEEPFLFNYRVGNKLKLKQGNVIAIEPMLNLGTDDVEVLDDEWTVITKDKLPSAHFEHTVMVGEVEPLILTTL